MLPSPDAGLVGAAVGVDVGEAVGASVGAVVGAFVGAGVGATVVLPEAEGVGAMVGATLCVRGGRARREEGVSISSLVEILIVVWRGRVWIGRVMCVGV